MMKMKIREYIEKEYLKGEIEDICTYGCIEGTCPGLIYYDETMAFYNEHEEEIWDIVYNQAREMGNNPLAFLGSLYGAKEVYDETTSLKPGDRVGVAWIAHTCGECSYCKRGLENLCVDFKATGCHIDGGYAEYMVAYSNYVYRLPGSTDPVKLAPLMCAGAVGYRALRLN